MIKCRNGATYVGRHSQVTDKQAAACNAAHARTAAKKARQARVQAGARARQSQLEENSAWLNHEYDDADGCADDVYDNLELPVGGASSSGSSMTNTTAQISRLEKNIRAWRTLETLKWVVKARAPATAAFRRHQELLEVASLQEQLNSLAHEPLPCPDCGQATEQSGVRLVNYRDVMTYGKLSVPIMKCTSCSFAHLLPAAAIGCVPSSPTNADHYFKVSMFFLYDCLRHSAKCSVESFCDSINTMMQNYRWYYLGAAGEPPALESNSFGPAYRHFATQYRDLSEPDIPDFEPG
jgi:hypothetical protein